MTAQVPLNPTDQLPITFAGRSDVMDFAGHVVRHIAESGHSGSVHFSPVWALDRSEVAHETERRWSTPLHHPGWGRALLLWTHVWSDPTMPRPSVVGHVELRGPHVASAMHRAELSVGIELAHRRRGHGERLCRAAIEWAASTGTIERIDLRVFAHNVKAKALYDRLGFERIGLVEDAFRMQDGFCVDDILMVKKVR